MKVKRSLRHYGKKMKLKRNNCYSTYAYNVALNIVEESEGLEPKNIGQCVEIIGTRIMGSNARKCKAVRYKWVFVHDEMRKMKS